MLNTNTGRMHHSGVGREWDGQPDLKELSPGDMIALSLCLSTKTLRVYAGGRLLGQMIAPGMRHKMRPPMRWAVDVWRGNIVEMTPMAEPLHPAVPNPPETDAFPKRGRRSPAAIRSALAAKRREVGGLEAQLGRGQGKPRRWQRRSRLTRLRRAGTPRWPTRSVSSASASSPQRCPRSRPSRATGRAPAP